jgi:hypothetical protein
MENDHTTTTQRLKRKRNEHHRLPRVQGGTRKSPKGNIVKVDTKRHEAWHTLFPGYMSVHQIVEEINKYWIDPRYEVTVQPTEEYLQELGQPKDHEPGS